MWRCLLRLTRQALQSLKKEMGNDGHRWNKTRVLSFEFSSQTLDRARIRFIYY